MALVCCFTAIGCAPSMEPQAGESAAPSAEVETASAAGPAPPAPPVASTPPSAAESSGTQARAFASFEVTDHSDPKSPTFVFSAGSATNKTPIVITVKGRATTVGDRDHRTSLQRHWLSVNVPEAYEFLDRALVECGPVDDGPFQGCDIYVFRDPATGVQHEYFFFVGNWPIE